MLGIVYGRVSTDEQGKQGHSLGEQVRICSERARAMGATEVVVFQDTISGSILDRPGLNDAREMVRSGASLFICLDPDRLARDLLLQLIVTEEIEKSGCKLVFVQHDYQNTPEGQMFYQFRGAISQYERAKIRERTERGRRASVISGKRVGGTVPFGYQHDPDSPGRLLVNEEEAEIVRYVFRQFIGGQSLGALAREVDSLGVRGRRGGLWTAASVRLILRNQTYTGAMAHRYPTDGGYATAMIPVPPIITPEVFEAAQKAMARNARASKARRGHHLLSGLCYCALCGRGSNYETVKELHVYLRCNATHKDYKRRGLACQAKSVRADEVERYVWQETCRALLSPEVYRERLLAQTHARVQVEEVRRLERERALVSKALEEASKNQETTVALLARGVVDEVVAEGIISSATQKIRSSRERLLQIDQDLQRYRDAEAQREAANKTLEAYRKQIGTDMEAVRRFLDTCGPKGRQEIVRRLVEKVVVSAGEEPLIIFRTDLVQM